MSAYGPPPARRGGPATVLPSTLVALPPPCAFSLSIHHLTHATHATHTTGAALADYLHAQFEDELVRGDTYPQEGPMGREAFATYFLGGDLFVGVVVAADAAAAGPLLGLEDARGNREWAACVGGVYYVKPNYPGRSSHICNAGFLVPPRFRGMGIGTALARSFLFYAPRLGYKASVFNLVYVNNVASVRIWEGLGFQKVGRIPRAGRLRRRNADQDSGGEAEGGKVGKGGDGEKGKGGGGEGGEEYVDAWVIYKDFENEDIMTIAP